jgi:hypothetical protein
MKVSTTLVVNERWTKNRYKEILPILLVIIIYIITIYKRIRTGLKLTAARASHDGAGSAAAVADARPAAAHLEARAAGGGLSGVGSQGRHASEGCRVARVQLRRQRRLGVLGRANRLAGLRSFDSRTSSYNSACGASDCFLIFLDVVNFDLFLCLYNVHSL